MGARHRPSFQETGGLQAAGPDSVSYGSGMEPYGAGSCALLGAFPNGGEGTWHHRVLGRVLPRGRSGPCATLDSEEPAERGIFFGRPHRWRAAAGFVRLRAQESAADTWAWREVHRIWLPHLVRP